MIYFSPNSLSMKPLIVLLATFALWALSCRIFTGDFEFGLAGRVALSFMLLFTAIGHFVFTKGMTMMIPPFLPFRTGLVYLTGLMEIVAAIILHFSAYTVITGWFLIAFFILLLPANIYAAINRIDYEKATTAGKGLGYLWFRVPFQLVLIGWTWFFLIR